MKKTKRILKMMLLSIVIITALLSNVYGYSVEIDPKSLISLPMTIYNGEGIITIKSTETGYSLYYQYVELSNTAYSQIEKIQADGKKEIQDIKAELEILNAEVNNAKVDFKEKEEAYKKAVESGNETEAKRAESEYKLAYDNYKKKIDEYNAKVKEHNNKINEINNKIKELIPSFVENKWIKTNDGKFKVDLSQFSGQRSFVVWVKLVSSDGTISYDQTIYTMNGVKQEEIKVTSVTLDKNSITIKEGSNYTLVATVNPTDATDKTVTWKSDNEKVAKVENGKVTAVSEGTATITVTTNDGNYTDTCKVTVTKKDSEDKVIKVTFVSLNKESVTIAEGSDYTLVATVNPTDATDKTVTWKSDNEKVAKVENGKVTAVSEGTATITVTTNDGNYTDTCKVTVTKKDSEDKVVKVNFVSLNKEKLSISEGSNYTLVAIVNPTDATDKTVTWKSDNEKVAKVENGKVTAISEGTATITVTTNDGNYTDTCKVTVTKKVEDNKDNQVKDPTAADGKIPQTGILSYRTIIAIVFISIIGIVTYIKNKKLNID